MMSQMAVNIMSEYNLMSEYNPLCISHFLYLLIDGHRLNISPYLTIVNEAAMGMGCR